MSKDAAIRFYNMRVNFVKNNKLFEENVAIKKVWQKDNNTFFDIYFYRTKKSYVYDARFIHDIMDLTNEKYYKNTSIFVEEFNNFQKKTAKQLPKTDKEPELVVDKELFQPIYVDLIILSFLAICCGNKTIVKKRIISEYIKKNIPSTMSLSDQYIETYINSLRPSEGDFYAALYDIKCRSQDGVENLSRELIKLCLSDGRLTYMEKMYMAEFLQALRNQGVDMDLGL